MKVDEALRMADALKAAADRAKEAGRDELLEADLDAFAALDDAARERLVAAIAEAKVKQTGNK